MSEVKKKKLPRDAEQKRQFLRRVFERSKAATDKEIFSYILEHYEGTSLRSLKLYKKQDAWVRRSEKEAQQQKVTPESVKRAKQKHYRKQKQQQQRAVEENVDKVLVEKEAKAQRDAAQRSGMPPSADQQGPVISWQISRSEEDNQPAISPDEEMVLSMHEMLLAGARESEILQWAQQKRKYTYRKSIDLLEKARDMIRTAGWLDLEYETNRARLRLEMLFKRALADKKDYRALMIQREIIDMLGLKKASIHQAGALDELVETLEDADLDAINNGQFDVLARYLENDTEAGSKGESQTGSA